jgi:hypothetical protein
MSVDGDRELDASDVGFVKDKKPFLKFAWYSDAVSFATERNIREGFQRAVKMTPILQTKIVEREDGRLVFTKHESEQDWPNVTVHTGDYDANQVVAMTNDLAEKEYAYYGHGASTEAMSVALRGHVVIGPKRLSLVMVWPHAYMDGSAVIGILVKSLMYSRLTKALWFTVDRLSCKDMPLTLEEVAFKKDSDKMLELKHELTLPNPSSVKLDPQNFSFSNYNATGEDEECCLRGGKFEFQTLKCSRINEVRKGLREAGVSISSALSALSVKTVAILLHKHQLNPDCRPLVASSYVDVRNLGKWGDGRDKRRLQLPISANLSVICCTQIPFEEAVEQGSLMKMAARVKQDIARLESDIHYRAETVFTAGYPKNTVICGTSSVMVPHMDMGKWTGIHNPYIETYEHYTQPHLWFTLVTMDKLSSTPGLYAGLPIPGLDMEQIFEAVEEAATGSPFEGIFLREGVEPIDETVSD